MPGGQHVRGAGAKEQRQYEHIKQSAEKSGRYGGRAKEVDGADCDEAAQTEGPLEGRVKPMTRYWSQRVTATSNALDLEPKVFSGTDARTIAESLKRSAERSKRRKGTPLQSAMSMLSFYINRAGGKLSAERKRVLESAKSELRKLYVR
jgi:uncharacterized protein DUF3175